MSELEKKEKFIPSPYSLDDKLLPPLKESVTLLITLLTSYFQHKEVLFKYRYWNSFMEMDYNTPAVYYDNIVFAK